MNFAVFLRDFDKFLSEFHGYSQKITNLFQILRKNARKIRKNAGNFRKSCRFHSFSSLVQSYPYQRIAAIRAQIWLKWYDSALDDFLLDLGPADDDEEED